MRYLLLSILAVMVAGGCASPPMLTELQKEKQTWLLAHGFRRIGGLVYSRSYGSVDLVRTDFTLGPDDVRGAPKTPLLGPLVLEFYSHKMYFTLRGAHDEQSLDYSQTECVVNVSLEEEVAGRYFALGFNSSRSLELRADGAFLMKLRVTNCDISQKDVEEKGTWTLQDHVVILRPGGKGKYGGDVWYARLLLKTESERRKLVCGVPGVWGYGKLGFEEETEEKAAQTVVTTGNEK